AVRVGYRRGLGAFGDEQADVDPSRGPHARKRRRSPHGAHTPGVDRGDATLDRGLPRPARRPDEVSTLGEAARGAPGLRRLIQDGPITHISLKSEAARAD